MIDDEYLRDPRLGSASTCRHCRQPIRYGGFFQDGRGPDNPPFWWHNHAGATCSTLPPGWDEKRDGWPLATPATQPAVPTPEPRTGAGEGPRTPETAEATSGLRARVRETILEAVDVRIAYGEPVWTINDAGVDQVIAAMEPHIRRQVAQEIARRIEGQCGQCAISNDPKIAAECEYTEAAAIARQVGGGQ